MRIHVSCVAFLLWSALIPLKAQAQFGQCGADAISPADAAARVAWARRCALNKLYTSQGYPVTEGSNPMIEYQEVDPSTNPSGQNAYHGHIMNFEVNSAYSYSLFTTMPYTQVLDSYGFYQWTSNSLRQNPYYPLFGSTPTPGVGSQLYPHPQLHDCNLYTDRSAYNQASAFYVTMYCNSGNQALANGVTLGGQSDGAGGEKHFTVAVPEGSIGLYIYITGGSGNTDLYVKQGSPPTTSSYNCASRSTGSFDWCYFSAAAGTYYVMLKGVTSYSNVSLTAIWNELSPGSPVSGLYAGWGAEKNYSFYVPGTATSATFNISGGTGDADIYVRYGAPPTLTQYDCRPYIGGNSETCTFNYPAYGTYYVMVRAYNRYSGVSLTANYYEPPDYGCFREACPEQPVAASSEK